MFTSDKLTRIQLEDASNFLSHEFPFVNSCELVIQLGTGQSPEGLFDEEWNRVELRYMPHIPQEESLVDHRLEIIWGMIGKHKVMVFSGRFHVYEGYGRIPCILPIWAAANCGVQNFLFTNAAGAMNPNFENGSVMLIDDHINNLGISALSGNQHLLREPFIEMEGLYKSNLQKSFKKSALKNGMNLHHGVYCAMQGPQFETSSEKAFLRSMGADAVGMSSVLESTTAHALGAQVLAMSIIINRAKSPEHKKLVDATDINSNSSKGQLMKQIHDWLNEDNIPLI